MLPISKAKLEVVAPRGGVVVSAFATNASEAVEPSRRALQSVFAGSTAREPHFDAEGEYWLSRSQEWIAEARGTLARPGMVGERDSRRPTQRGACRS